MQLGRVIGTVVARRVYEGLGDKKLLLVEPMNHDLRVVGDPFVAVDVAQAGEGDIIFFVGSREAALACEPWFVPVDAAIVGIVDAIPSGPVGATP